MVEHTDVGSAHAYIMVTVEPSQTRQVLQELRAIPGAGVHEVLGPYDIVVELETETQERIASILREKVRSLPGVLSTVTCTWME